MTDMKEMKRIVKIIYTTFANKFENLYKINGFAGKLTHQMRVWTDLQPHNPVKRIADPPLKKGKKLLSQRIF